MSDQPRRVIVCQGPPRCDLMGADAAAAMKAGCVWCHVSILNEDGTFDERGPSDDMQPGHDPQ